ncbi:hypothetical protein WL766_08560 [Staphylococcus pasteuri]|uniref:hypothetical protein n=2 Tax=Bacillati TaxID=1783272 RepID=UPI0008A51E02|nr:MULTISPECIES: hypothetical protein [Staphylococcus]RQX28684.1 hypothetical protein DB792_02795 [Staphylococcus warneri]MCO0860524.1 hypothetical protein [Staphylococcus pasteuri]MCO5359291.1 hypothetical protein [Staphylococcus pasteuri]OFV13319.1 hypothetical protein HMPREF3125_00565 [Staphylococcus sp. HMSC13A10]UXR66516.1 hypothetical protein MUA61_07280 [Staphylococcus pasteuri]
MTTIITLISLAICISIFYLMSIVSIYYLRLILGIVLSFGITFLFTFSILFEQLNLVLPILIFVMLIEIIDLRIKVRKQFEDSESI